MAGSIRIEFDDNGQVEFDIKASNDAQLIIAILGLEGYFGRMTGLGSTEIREILDEEKEHLVVKPNEVTSDVIEVEVD